jgi:hypothetical protein
MRKTVLLAVCVLLIAGCGGKKATPASVASAIGSKNVASLFKKSTGLEAVRDVTCTESAISGNFSCTGTPTFVTCRPGSGPAVPCASTTAPTKAWVACFPNEKTGPKLDCRLENPPAGLNVFVTAAQRAAAKVATWRCVDLDYDGNAIGPLTISIAKSFGPVETEPNAMSKAHARVVALAMHLPLRTHCG